jgi:alpha-amylase
MSPVDRSAGAHAPAWIRSSLRRGVQGALAATLLVAASAASAQTTPRTAFVHLLEWKWTDVARECESHLGPKGFAAVQVSPPNEHNWIASGDGAPYPWWMRYQPVSYSLDRSRSGTRSEFVNMVNRCQAVGVSVYVDAVINHMSGGTGGSSSAGNGWSHHHYPRVPYDTNDFHKPVCGINGSDYTTDAWRVFNCELSGLQDLNTGSGKVRGKIADYLVDLVNIGVRGFRVDAAKHIDPADLGAIIDTVNSRVATRPFWYLEVIQADGEKVQPSQYFGLDGNRANVLEFKYGAQVSAKFNGRLADLRTFGESWGLSPSAKGVPFIDNHDKQRGHGGGGNYLTYHAGATYDLANVFMLAWPYGYPQVMSSYAFVNSGSAYDASYGPPHNGDGSTRGPWDGGVSAPACFSQTRGGWVCEHRFRPIANMVAFRNATQASWRVDNWWDNGNNQIAFGRGDKGFVVINKEGSALSRSFTTGLPAGQYCDVISGDLVNGSCTGAVVTVNASGAANIAVAAYSAVALHVGAKVGNGGGGDPGTGSASVTFKVTASTVMGQNVYVVGNHAALGSWSPAGAKAMTVVPGTGSGQSNQWQATFSLPAGTALEYKYIKRDGSGNTVWESGSNRAFTTPAAGGSATRTETWK